MPRVLSGMIYTRIAQWSEYQHKSEKVCKHSTKALTFFRTHDYEPIEKIVFEE